MTEPDYKFELGKGVVLREGKDVTIVATGLPVSECLEAAEKLAADGIDAKVINIHTIKPLDEDLIVAAAKETGKVVTVEEHSVIGGLGSAVCDVLAEKAPTKVLKNRCERYIRRVPDRQWNCLRNTDLIQKVSMRKSRHLYKRRD